MKSAHDISLECAPTCPMCDDLDKRHCPACSGTGRLGVAQIEAAIGEAVDGLQRKLKTMTCMWQGLITRCAEYHREVKGLREALEGQPRKEISPPNAVEPNPRGTHAGTVTGGPSVAETSQVVCKSWCWRPGLLDEAGIVTIPCSPACRDLGRPVNPAPGKGT